MKVLLPAILFCPLVTVSLPAVEAKLPNIVLIVMDDLGYADLGSQGAQGHQTPHMDRLAAEGIRFTDFYVAQAVCTASRAAFLSGCLPNRIGLQGAINPTSKTGIHSDEWLLPEMLRERGYATAIIGKWHLGNPPAFSPLRHGFDEWFGLPYSNDNSKYHPFLGTEMPPLPVYDGERIVEVDPDQSLFTRRFTERAVAFIECNSTRPFFLYLAHVMPHVPIFASDRFRGRSARGLYGDVVEELDWSVGEVVRTLQRLGLDERTLIVLFSDNGPWLSYGEHAGAATPFREGKLTSFEGGVRVPCIVRWPGRVPAGRVSAKPWMSIDLLPTLAALVGGKSSPKKIDGLDARPLLLGEKKGAKSPHETLFFYAGDELQAVRNGRWKLHFPHPFITVAGAPGKGGKPSEWGRLQPDSLAQSGIEAIASRHGGRITTIGLSLYNLDTDPAESINLAAQNPDIVARLSRLAEPMRVELGDALTGTKPTGARPVGQAN